MGQFKPMVKMETTEPSVILKLKKGGHVAMKSKGENGHAPMKKMDGGAMGAMSGTPALIGRPALNAPVRAPSRPSMAARRMAMMAAQRPRMAAPAADMPMMKKGGKAEGGDVDMKQDKAMIKKAFKQHDIQEHKSGKGTKLALKKGGRMAVGGVPLGAGGYKKGGIATGGVTLGNAGGFKKGGAAKKFADGGLINTGRAVSMPQGHKKPTPPVATNLRSGTFKKGGGVKRLNSGSDAQSIKETKGYKDTYTTQRDENLADREAMNPMTYIRPLVDKVKGMFGSSDAPGAVTKTKESTTVVPAKKRSGGKVDC
jgi:hypothetical protein